MHSLDAAARCQSFVEGTLERKLEQGEFGVYPSQEEAYFTSADTYYKFLSAFGARSLKCPRPNNIWCTTYLARDGRSEAKADDDKADRWRFIIDGHSKESAIRHFLREYGSFFRVEGPQEVQKIILDGKAKNKRGFRNAALGLAAIATSFFFDFSVVDEALFCGGALASYFSRKDAKAYLLSLRRR